MISFLPGPHSPGRLDSTVCSSDPRVQGLSTPLARLTAGPAYTARPPPSGGGAAEQQRGGDRECGQPAEADQQRPGFLEAGGECAVDEQAGAAVAGQVGGLVGGFAAQHRALPDADVPERDEEGDEHSGVGLRLAPTKLAV
ncbi:MAG: hypothetical protein ACRD0W_19980 [Acidimicrobiales bacterium]